MHSARSPLILYLVYMALMVLISVFHLGCKLGNSDNNSPKFKEVTVQRGTFLVIVTANGVVKPINRIEIKSKASGIVEDLPVEEGDFIKKGDLIARLDQKDELAEFGQAQANYDIAKAELKQAQKSFERRNKLFNQNLISEEERDQIELSLAVANGKLIQAETTLERAKERLSESIVRAPIDGIILQKYVEKGQIIASGVSNVSGGTPIVDIADMQSVYIEAGIDEIDVGKVGESQSAMVTAEAYPDLLFKGKIDRISPEARIEQNVTLFDVIVGVENLEGKLKSGMNTTIEITIVRKDSILLVPAMALQPMEKKNTYRVLLKKEGKFKPHPVEVGLSDFKNAEVISGLQEGDIIGIAMISRLKDENDQREERIRRSRSFGTTSR
ncbi:MAG: efflux RND transporter periplasmic adaptor subunit [Calditrichia bacterium]|nr:efflux RND transporter periplasmic adaptor subunit [Calditrichia bacterium]